MFKRKVDRSHVALALGSGSAKGIAHIGVIETLIAYDCNIVALAGTSIGAIIGSYYVLGKLDILKEWILSADKRTTFSNLDFIFNGGFIGGKKIMNIIKSHIGDARFEDTNIPFYVIATNLDLGKEEAFDTGSILEAIRASISIPGIFKPHRYNGSYYVDGAVSNPVPVDVLYNRGYKDIVAVNLNSRIDKRDKKSAPGIIDNLFRSMDILTNLLTTAQTKNAAAVITPDVDNIKIFDVYKSLDIIEEGKRATERIFIDNNIIIDRRDSRLQKLRDALFS